MTDVTHDDGPLRGHAFDGIQEYDNRLPNWWLWTFYGACIFSLFYWLHFHVLGTGPLPRDQYRAEMEAAAARLATMEVSNETLTALAAEPAAREAGQKIFVKHCTQCHKADAGGSIGPNLTDKFWIHGATPMDIYNTIVTGVPEKGMPNDWMRKLGPLKCQQVTAYILTIKNTNVAGGKAPQGDPEQ